MVRCIFALWLVQNLGAADAANMAASLDEKVAMLSRAGQYEEAERHQKRALRLWEEAARSRPLNLGVPHANLAEIYLAQGKLSKAEAEARLALELASAAQAGEAAAVLLRTEALFARIEYFSGRYAEAERHQQAVVERLKHAGWRNSNDIASAWNDLAMIVATRGDYRRARPLAEGAIEVLRRAKKTTDSDYGSIAGNLALICLREGDFAAADRLYRESITVLESALGGEHAHVGMLLAEHAQVLRKTGRRSEARPLERRAKGILASSVSLPGRHIIDIRGWKP
jgi:tetratricopeptide (TPR) repeat protein